MLTKTKLTQAIAAVTCGLAAGQAIAEEIVLEEIMVTATKRETSIQEMPMSIQAMAGEKMHSQGIENLDQLAASIPSFQVGDGVLSTNISMRGMGSQPERGFEQSVGMFIDGLYMPRSRQYRAPFMDANRVEILRGPQAVLFGLNSTAGAVSVVSNTTNPGDDFEANLTAKYEFEHQGATVEGVVGGSLGDLLGLRLAAKHRKDDEGHYKNDFSGNDEGAPKETVLRGTAIWEPSEATSLTLKVDYADFESDGDFGEAYDSDLLSAALFGAGQELKNNWRRNMDGSGGSVMKAITAVERDKPGIQQESLNVGLTFEQEFGEHTLTAILGYSDLQWDSFLDLDGTPLFVASTGFHEEYEQKSVEVRWTSPEGQAFDWIVGAYYQEGDLENAAPNMLGEFLINLPSAFGGLGLGVPAGPALVMDAEMGNETKATSVFAIGTLNVSDTFSITGGVRWVDTEIDYERANSPCTTLHDGSILTWGGVDSGDATLPQDVVNLIPDALFCTNALGFQDERTSHNLMPELAAQWDVTGDLMVYGKVSKSAKSGGFGFSTQLADDINGNPKAEYDDEKALGYEVGLKLQRDTYEVNATVYRTEFEDLQVNSFDPNTGAGSIENAAEVVTQGVELDGRWAAASWLTLSGSVAWLDAEFEEFNAAPCPYDGSLQVNPAAPVGANACIASGVDTAYAPEWAGSLAADIILPLGDSLEMVGGVYLSYSDDYYTDSSLAEALIQDSYTKVDARIGVQGNDGLWSVSLIGNNLTNEEIINNSQVFFSAVSFLKAPRTIALQGTYRFGM